MTPPRGLRGGGSRGAVWSALAATATGDGSATGVRQRLRHSTTITAARVRASHTIPASATTTSKATKATSKATPGTPVKGRMQGGSRAAVASSGGRAAGVRIGIAGVVPRTGGEALKTGAARLHVAHQAPAAGSRGAGRRRAAVATGVWGRGRGGRNESTAWTAAAGVGVAGRPWKGVFRPSVGVVVSESVLWSGRGSGKETGRLTGGGWVPGRVTIGRVPAQAYGATSATAVAAWTETGTQTEAWTSPQGRGPHLAGVGQAATAAPPPTCSATWTRLAW